MSREGAEGGCLVRSAAAELGEPPMLKYLLDGVPPRGLSKNFWNRRSTPLI